MIDLPLFPLNTVLFPGASLYLHIFEERYKRMIQLCLASHQPFGVVLIRQGMEALGPLAEPYSIGCSAEIVQVQKLPEGRMNLAAIGQERFQVLSLDDQAEPYLLGRVKPYPLDNPDPARLEQAGQRLRAWVERYAEVAATSGQGKLTFPKLPGDAVQLAYLAASLAPIPLKEKQALLSAEAALELTTDLQRIYKREVAVLKKIIAGMGKDSGSFSRN